ncbi:hypothetical protein [Lentibacillus sp. CBA3610]|uniref:hypothetical protein n=1 Tax=Lentibacillus sp. CBA3610 TaxID=2518176 RepID=UPI001594FF94|nr:hypothetical protein [Lentibacillus sp. CBA3610]QKY70440.1 hypothetical protein Len3610_13320 [Lentibacillus sp. CBA3610]
MVMSERSTQACEPLCKTCEVHSKTCEASSNRARKSPNSIESSIKPIDSVTESIGAARNQSKRAAAILEKCEEDLNIVVKPNKSFQSSILLIFGSGRKSFNGTNIDQMARLAELSIRATSTNYRAMML